MLGRPWPAARSIALAPLLAGLVALALALLAPGSAAAASGPGGPLTPELARLAAPAIAAKPAPQQAAALGLPAAGPGSLARERERVIVEARFDAGALARLGALRAAGAKVLVASRRYQTVALAVDPADLKAVAAVPGIAALAPSRRPILYGAGGAVSTAATPSNGLCEGGSVISQGLQQLNVPAARAAFGARGAGQTIGVLSDSFASATTAIEGGPIATTAHDDEVSNDLPGQAGTCSGQLVPVRVIAEAPPPAPGEEPLTDEGRAMLQVIHDLAPHAQLAFATAISSELEFARNIERLAEPVAAGGAGADVIVDDVGYSNEPFFQEGPVAVAIQKVTGEGVTYLTAAGNDNVIEEVEEVEKGEKGAGNQIGSWEAPAFRNAGSCPAEVQISKFMLENGGGIFTPACMNFSRGTPADTTFGITVEAGETLSVDLQWAEPWGGVKTDLDAFLLNKAENEVLAAAMAGNAGTGLLHQPAELLQWENSTAGPVEVQLVINRCSGICNAAASAVATPRLKFAFLGGGVSAIEYPRTEGEDVVGPTVYGHAGSPAAITLGAIPYWEPAATPAAPEPYSSHGPVTHYFGPVTGTTAAAELPTPERIAKPNLTATDCASTTFFASFVGGRWYFCGTSEAAPHAAAVAALMRQAAPLAAPAALVGAMEASATRFTAVTDPMAVGAGLLNAAAAIGAFGGGWVEDPPSYVVASPAVEAAAPAPVVRITKGPKPLGNEPRPTFEFTSTRPVAFSCQIDGGTPQPCASPYLVPSRLADGAHGFVVIGTDAQGRSGSSGIYSFTVDTRAPRTWIVRHPRKVVKTAKRNVVARFRLRSNEAPVTFYCQFDREALRICPARFNHRFGPGAHALKVRARDAAGNLAARPTVFRFRVKELRAAFRARPYHVR